MLQERRDSAPYPQYDQSATTSTEIPAEIKRKQKQLSALQFVSNLVLIGCFFVLALIKPIFNLSATLLAPAIMSFLALGILDFVIYIRSYQDLRQRWLLGKMTAAEYYQEYFLKIFPSLLASIFAFSVAAVYPVVAFGGGPAFITALAFLEAAAPWVFVFVFAIKFVAAYKNLIAVFDAERYDDKHDEHATKRKFFAYCKLFIAGTTFTCATLFLLNAQLNLPLIAQFVVANLAPFLIPTAFLCLALIVIPWGAKANSKVKAIGAGLAFSLILLYAGFGLGYALLMNPVTLAITIGLLIAVGLLIKLNEPPPLKENKSGEIENLNNSAKTQQEDFNNELSRDKKYSYRSLVAIVTLTAINAAFAYFGVAGTVITYAASSIFACIWLGLAVFEFRRMASSLHEATQGGLGWTVFTMGTKTLPAFMTGCISFACFAGQLGSLVPFFQYLSLLSTFTGIAFPLVLALTAVNEFVAGKFENDKNLAHKHYASSAMMVAAGIILLAVLTSNPGGLALMVLWSLATVFLMVGKWALDKSIGVLDIPTVTESANGANRARASQQPVQSHHNEINPQEEEEEKENFSVYNFHTLNNHFADPKLSAKSIEHGDSSNSLTTDEHASAPSPTYAAASAADSSSLTQAHVGSSSTSALTDPSASAFTMFSQKSAAVNTLSQAGNANEDDPNAAAPAPPT